MAVWLCFLSLSSQLVFAQEDGDDDESETTEGPVPTTPESFGINFDHKDSSTSSITVGWRVPERFPVSKYEVSSQKTSTNATMHSGDLDPEENEYVIEDLATHTEYYVCVYAHVTLEDASEESVEKECHHVETIPVIRVDSVVALLGVVGFIALLILIGYLVWKQAVKKAEAEKEDEEEEEKIKPNEQPQTYLGAPPNNAPKSSIEDQDIPYITPPVEQLSPSEKDQYKKALVWNNIH